MLALFAVFEHLTNLRRLLNRIHIHHTSPTRCPVTTVNVESDEKPSNINDEHEILLGPIVTNIRENVDCQDEFQDEEYFARELDACLLEMRQIERDLYDLKQRQCSFYEHYLDFIDKKDQLIDRFIEYHDEFISHRSRSPSPTQQQIRRQPIRYEFTVPVSNRFELLKRHH